MKVSYASQIEKIETRADGSVKIVLGTSKEMSPSDKTALFSLADKNGWTVHSMEDDIEEQDIPTERADPGIGKKTSSQRLRAVLYVYWEQGGKKGSFEDFYRVQVEKLIEHIKDKLE